MKFKTLSILALMLSASSAMGQFSGYHYGPSTETYRFTQSGSPYQLQICDSQVCKLGEGGALELHNVTGGVNALLQTVATEPDENYLVFYPAGKEGIEDERRVLRKRFLVKLKEGAKVEEVKQRCGISVMNLLFPHQGLAVCEAESAIEVLDLLEASSGDPGVVYAEPLFARKRHKKKVPNDTFFLEAGALNGGYQWSLNDTGGETSNPDARRVDINVEDSWDLLDSAGGPITGSNVRIAVVDDGVFSTHPDLTVDTISSLDVIDGDNDANPVDVFDTHGTEVAGIIGASWDNDQGIAGIAPESVIIGVRLLGFDIDDLQESQALALGSDETNALLATEISNNSWGPSDFETTLEPIGPLAKAAIEEQTRTQRLASSGTVFVWAAGNGGEINDNSNYDGYAALPETIAVGATTDQGVKATYSERGANLVVSAPSSGGELDITTTTFVEGEDGFAGDYSTSFGGTSAAVPHVSGVVAQMIQAKKFLGWREVQEILMATATRIDPDHPDWYQNAAGFWFNHDYGAGLVNAADAVQAVLALPPGSPFVPPLLPDRGEPLVVDQFPVEEIPDGTGDSYVLTFDLSDQPNRRVEHVELLTTIISERRADLDITLVSPSGTQSILAQAHDNSDEQSINNWTFMTVRNWGEGSQGTWYLRVTDRNPGNRAFLNNVRLIVHGPENETAPVGAKPVLISDRVVNAIEGVRLEYQLSTLGSQGAQINNLPEGLTFNPSTSKVSGVPTEGGVFPAELILTGLDGSTASSTISFVVRPTTFALGAGVEQDARPTISTGNIPWGFEFLETVDGEDSIASPFGLGDNLEARFGFDDVPTAIALFKWKVSSQAGADRLWVTLDGGQLPSKWSAFVDGEKEWSTVAVPLPKSSNQIEWVYKKDNTSPAVGETAGADRAFIDEVEFQSVDTYRKSVEAAGNFAADFDYILGSRTLFIPVEDPDASDQRALRSSGIGHGQQVSLSAWVDGPASVSFDYKTSIADSGDVLEYLVNGIVRNSASGLSAGYVTVTDTLPEGRHYIEIRFRKDIDGSAGLDSVWLDNVVVQTQSSALTWAGTYGLGGTSMDRDSDGDGYTNLEEYAFGGNPTVRDIPPLVPANTTDGLNRWIEYGIDSRNSDLVYEVQESTDLENWTETGFSTYDRTEGDIRYYRIPIFENNPGQPKRYYRVQVSPRR
ncbi:MAG: S8 family serine peptidase [Akkermansiaceae bacterium]